jgi:hypothetical protein
MAIFLALVVAMTTGLFPHAPVQSAHHHAPVAQPLDSVGGMTGG